MSPFANSPHLWLTAHLRRLEQQEHVPKIQAVARGFLVRRRQDKQRLIKETEERLQSPSNPVSRANTLVSLNLGMWAAGLPTATEALRLPEADAKRREAMRNASICLRFLGKSHLIPDIEWADYHERAAALRDTCDATINPGSMWSRFKKFVWE